MCLSLCCVSKGEKINRKLKDLLYKASKWCSGLVSSYNVHIYMLFRDVVTLIIDTFKLHQRLLSQWVASIWVWKEDIGILNTQAESGSLEVLPPAACS